MNGIVFNVDLLTVGLAVALAIILGVIVFFQKTSSLTNRLFLVFTTMNASWSVFNYLNYQARNPSTILLLIRLVLTLAVLQVFSFFMLMWVFPEEKKTIPKWFKVFLFPLTSIVAILTLTPVIFKGVTISPNLVSVPIAGPGIPLFGITAIGFVVSGIYLLIRKIVQAPKEEKKPYRYLLVGVIVMFFFIILFNFFFPTFFGNTRFIPLSSIFTLPFVFFTAYAIFRHKLFNAKVISTEVLVLVLALATFVEIIVADSVAILILRSSVFLLVLGVGVLLIRSVIREVKQREELQVLTEQLGEANDKLQALDKARAEFISIASHQLRTPPATIKWYVGAIMDGDFGPLSEDLKASLQRVESTNNSQISLIDDLLNASRIERGKLEFFFEMGDIEPLAKITVDQLLPQAQMHKLQLIYQPPSKPLPQVMLDKEKVRQVINNFIDNAIKYTKQGSITVHFEQTANDVEVRVTDTGRGVAPDVAPTLFEKYTRGKDAATAASGLGLGLYVAKVVIEQNNGKIWVESPGEGKGSTFAFSLPIHSTLESTSTVDLAQDQGAVQAQAVPPPTKTD